MSGGGTITVQLTPAALTDLTAMGRACGLSGAELAASLLSLWIGKRVEAVGQGGAARLTSRRDKAAARFAVLYDWIRSGRPPARFKGHSRSTLYLWERRWQAGGLDGLADGRADPKHGPTQADNAGPFMDEIRRRLVGSRRNRPAFTAAYRAAVATAREKGWKTTSEKTARRFIKGQK